MDSWATNKFGKQSQEIHKIYEIQALQNEYHIRDVLDTDSVCK